MMRFKQDIKTANISFYTGICALSVTFIQYFTLMLPKLTRVHTEKQDCVDANFYLPWREVPCYLELDPILSSY